MCVTCGDYKKFGYYEVPAEHLKRYLKSAENTVKRFINNYRDSDEIFSDDNKRGVCEIANLLYAENNQLNRSLAGFSNENYREQYFEGDSLNHGEKIWDIMTTYFTREQLYRGI